MDAIPLHRRQTSLTAMLNSIVTMMEPHASSIGVKLTTNLEAGLPATVPVDEDKIAWAVGTLIGNALRHVPRGPHAHGGGEISVDTSHSREPGAVIIEVTDNGPGIPADRLPLLFQPAPYQRRIGYALILAREIIEAHGGRREAESTVDPRAHGTTIRFVLPNL